ncbi:hypothetical protein HOLDEFILI_03092 [Holdemania filiformis DSM 12042]|uniref:Uncharacterized protein n=1 Tax=Holdemania filiformis DSM 12042 TaxID=545696 RepID=B9YB85_9FIRM|nr:hypothetical protein HOLDEFILI_03092 [Holdemania filiformis DSM 12042]
MVCGRLNCKNHEGIAPGRELFLCFGVSHISPVGKTSKNGGICLKLFYALRKNCDKIVKVNI